MSWAMTMLTVIPMTRPVRLSSANKPLSLLDQIAEDWEAHDRDFFRPGFQALVVHRFGTWRMRIGPRVLRAPLSLLYRAMQRRVRNLYGIELPYTARVGRRVVIEHQSGIVIHGNSEIGDDCIIRQNVTLGNRSLDRPLDAPRLGNRVCVGAGAKVLGAVRIGDGAQIGANAVVCDDVPANAVAVGVPAHITRVGEARKLAS
jgi:serine O-acetyltransferase